MARLLRLLIAGAPALAIAFALASLSTAPVAAQARPDLVVREISDPPLSGLPGDSFAVTARIRNRGQAGAAESTTKFFLASTTNPTRKNLRGVQTVPALGPGLAAESTVTVELFSDTLPGTYTLQACADGVEDMAEEIESNNCRSSLGTIVVEQMPDLRVTALSAPPSSASQGQPFSTTVTVLNEGPVRARRSTVKFRLVSVADGTRKDMKNTLQMSGLGPGRTFTETFTVAVDPDTSPGLYRQQACADSARVVREGDENDNCFTNAATIQVTPRPDLLVQSVTVTGAPVRVGLGDSVAISATVANQGEGAAAASTMKYHLVPQGGGTAKNLDGTQVVPQVAQGATATVSATVRVFSDTPLGTYVARACVDSEEVVPEGVENNNCAESSGTVTVADIPPARPDLVVTALTNPPASILPRGTFPVTATVKNDGTASSAASTTRFYLRSTTGPTRKNLRGEQSVAALDPSATASPEATVELFSDTVGGTYVLEACADGPDDLPESNDDNNCRSTAATIDVLQMPDLVVTTVSSPPTSASTGDAFAVTSTVQNVGDVDAPASSAKFYLRSTTAPHPRKDLRGRLDVPALAPGETFTDQRDVTVQTGTASGTYELQGCADSGKDIAEEDEDNCAVADGTIQVQAIPLPDLVVQTLNVKDPPVTVAPGGTFVVRGRVANVGTGDAGETTLRYWLVPVAGGALKNLQGGKVVPAVPAGTTSDVLRRQVTVFSDTVPGSYRIHACVDPLETVTEESDGNNCKVSNAVVTVQ